MPAPEKKQNTAAPDRFSSVSEHLDQVRQCIIDQLVTESDSINAVVEHVSSAHGKMLRPAMVLLSGAACGAINPKHIQLAAITEMVHTATLLHDDVIDEAKSRRSAETVNTLWGNEAAVLLGDLFMSKAYAMQARIDNPRISAVLADTAVSICQGEMEQNLQRRNFSLSEAQYTDIVTGKTASLFGCCCAIGAIAADAAENVIAALTDYGMSVGIAFQITDDLLDISGDEVATGKTAGRDVEKNKLTLPLIHLLENHSDRAKVEQLLNQGKAEELIEMMEKTFSLNYARTKAENHCKRAIESLSCLKDSKVKKQLTQIAKTLAARCS